MVTEVLRSPSISARQKNKIIGKRKTFKNNFGTQVFEIKRLAREKFLQEKLVPRQYFDYQMLLMKDVIHEIF